MNDKSSSIRLIALGDISLNGRYKDLFEKRGTRFPCQSLVSEWSGSNIVVANLESPITDQPRYAPSKCSLRAPFSAAEFLVGTNISAVCLSNNHAMDYGIDGLADTIDVLSKNGVQYFGAGLTEDTAMEASIICRNNQKIGFLAFCDVEQSSPLYAAGSRGGVNRLDLNRCIEQVKSLKNEVDRVIVNLHWGLEMALIPSPEQRTIARNLINAGADLILGHHPHVVQPMEWIDSNPVFYSLGNFLFSDMYWKGLNPDGRQFWSRLRLHPLSRLTGWADVTFSKTAKTKACFRLARLRKDLSVVPDQSGRRRVFMEKQATRLELPNYAGEYEKEANLAQQRTNWRWAWKPLLRRIEMRLYCRGWIPNAVEGT